MRSDLASMAGAVDRARAAISMLEPPRRKGGAGKEQRKKFLRSICGEINAACLRGVSWKGIVEALGESAKFKMTATTLAKLMKEIEAEDKDTAARIAREAVEKRRNEA